MPQIYDMGPTALPLLRRKACWGFFRPKNSTASAGFEPANLGTKGQHATTRPPKQSIPPHNISSRSILKLPSLIYPYFFQVPPTPLPKSCMNFLSPHAHYMRCLSRYSWLHHPIFSEKFPRYVNTCSGRMTPGDILLNLTFPLIRVAACGFICINFLRLR